MREGTCLGDLYFQDLGAQEPARRCEVVPLRASFPLHPRLSRLKLAGDQ